LVKYINYLASFMSRLAQRPFKTNKISWQLSRIPADRYLWRRTCSLEWKSRQKEKRN